MDEKGDVEYSVQLYVPSEPSVLDWLLDRLRYLLGGKWLFRSTSHKLENDVNGAQVEVDRDVTESRKIERNRGSRAQSECETTDIVHIMLSLEVPFDSRLEMSVESTEGDENIPEVEIHYQNSKGKPARIDDVPLMEGGRLRLVKVGKLAGVQVHGKKVFFSLAKQSSIMQLSTISMILFFLSLGIYMMTRLIGLDEFPIYFFTDEAIHTILAENLVSNGFRYLGEFLPTYFPMGASYGLNSVSVYSQVLPYLLFGKSIYVTRATSVAITLLGAIAVGYIVKDFFKSPYWWVSILLLSITPAWFLHSRTAFESVLVASFYACFLYFYLRYRLISPRALYLAIIFGALAFYSHGLGEFLMAVTGFLLAITDFRYHWQHRKILMWGALLFGILLLPYLRFTMNNPQIFTDQMRQRASYWTDQDLNLAQKTACFVKEYASGYNPVYWFNPKPVDDLVRHVMKGYGHFLLPSLVFVLWGIIIAIKHFRSPAHRTILIALLAAPFGAAFAQVTVLRAIWMVIPVTILATLGISSLLRKLENRLLARNVLSLGVFVILAGFNFYMLWDALVDGPTWYNDYRLYGMQYGAKQLFAEAIPEVLMENPETRVVVSPTWANGTDTFEQFFLTPEQQSRVSFNSIEAFLYEKLPVDPNLVLVLPPDEYQTARDDAKIGMVNIDRVIEYPDGTAGFYFVRFQYADNADEIFAAEREARKQLVESMVDYDGQTILVRNSMLDIGEPAAMFDGDFYTLVRGLEANPFIIDLTFEEPRLVSGVVADFANMDFTITAYLYEDLSSDALEYSATIRDVSGDAHIEFIFNNSPTMIERLRLEIQSLSEGDRAHIHVRELKLLP